MKREYPDKRVRILERSFGGVNCRSSQPQSWGKVKKGYPRGRDFYRGG